nr:hypothetical protein [Brucella intermedia]
MGITLKLAAVLSALIVAVLASPARAIDAQLLAAAAASYRDGAAAQQLEDRIADLIEAGDKAGLENGIVMIDGSEIDSTNATLIHTCENVNALPAHKARIGSRCYFTGACGDDPDMD